MIIVAARRPTLDSEFLSQGCGARPSGRERGVIKPCHLARRSLASTAFAVLLLTLLPRALSAQTLPAGPATAFDGRLAAGAEVVATIGDRDESAFFNYTDYEHNVLRMFRVALSGSWRPFERLAFVGEVQSEDLTEVRPYAAYVRIRPIRSVPLDIQAGRIPPVFGSFGRRAYNVNNPVIGYPLAYQYLTSLRPDAIPATHDDLLRMRARGWLATYPIGSPDPAPGIPLISAFRWDTGVQAHWRHEIVEVAGAVTAGTLADPRVSDNNSGRQISGRVALHPVTGLIVGTSAAHGEWLDREVMELLPADAPTYDQTAWGLDAEYSRDHWIVRAELVKSRWQVPFAAIAAAENVDALGAWVEGRYRFTPRIFAGARIDHLGFSKISTDTRGALVTWEAPVTRVEGAAGYYLQRNLVARLTVQFNDRDGGRIQRRTYFAGQLAYWF